MFACNAQFLWQWKSVRIQFQMHGCRIKHIGLTFGLKAELIFHIFFGYFINFLPRRSDSQTLKRKYDFIEEVKSGHNQFISDHIPPESNTAYVCADVNDVTCEMCDPFNRTEGEVWQKAKCGERGKTGTIVKVECEDHALSIFELKIFIDVCKLCFTFLKNTERVSKNL